MAMQINGRPREAQSQTVDNRQKHPLLAHRMIASLPQLNMATGQLF